MVHRNKRLPTIAYNAAPHRGSLRQRARQGNPRTQFPTFGRWTRIVWVPTVYVTQTEPSTRDRACLIGELKLDLSEGLPLSKSSSIPASRLVPSSSSSSSSGKN